MSLHLDPANLSSLKVLELRKELKDRGISLPASAKKSDLIAKLAEALGIRSPVTDTAAAILTDSAEDLSSTGSGTAAVPAVVIAAGAATAPSQLQAAVAPAAPLSSASAPDILSSNGSAAAPATEVGAVSVSAAQATSKTVVSGAGVKDKLAARAARFGGSAAGPTPTISIGTGEQLAALKKRGERFGEVVSSTVKSLEAKEKLNQRASRFNLSDEELNPTTKLGLLRKVKSSPSEKRPITASTPAEEERLRKRRERFGLT